jgi:hypothetical protein
VSPRDLFHLIGIDSRVSGGRYWHCHTWTCTRRRRPAPAVERSRWMRPPTCSPWTTRLRREAVPTKRRCRWHATCPRESFPTYGSHHHLIAFIGLRLLVPHRPPHARPARSPSSQRAAPHSPVRAAPSRVPTLPSGRTVHAPPNGSVGASRLAPTDSRRPNDPQTHDRDAHELPRAYASAPSQPVAIQRHDGPASHDPTPPKAKRNGL